MAVTPAGAVALLAAGRALLDPADPSARRPAALPGLPDDLLRLAFDHADLDHATAALAASPSLYRAALGAGLHALLERFQTQLLDVEAQLAEDPGLTITHVQYALRDAAASLAAVARAVAHVQAHEHLRGGALLNFLFQHSLSGDAATADAFRRLLHAVHQPWFAQLTHWLAYGEVDDSARGDFMVVPRTLGGDDTRAASPRSSSSSAGAIAVLPCAGAPQSGRAAAAALRPLLAEHEWSDGYVIDAFMVPDAYVSAASAADILAIGKAVRLLRHHDVDGDDEDTVGGVASADEDGSAAAVVPRGSGSGSGSRAAASSPLAASHGSRARDSREDGAYDGTGGAAAAAGGGASTAGATRITREDSLAISRLLATLRNAPTFSGLAFDVIVSRVRAVVYARLWRLLLDEGGGSGGAADGGLLTHTRALRDYLLMGRGDLFQAFLELGGPAMAATAAHAPHALQALTRGAWMAAVQAATPHDVVPAHAGGDHDASSSHGLHQSSSSAASVGGGSTAYRPLGASGLWGSGGSVVGGGAATGGGRSNAVGDPCLNRCSLTLLHRGVKWEGDAAGALARGWHPTAPGGYVTSDAVARVHKVGVLLVTRGGAATAVRLSSQGGGEARRHGLPLSPLTAHAPQPSAGAAWLSQPVSVAAGCLLRAGARLSWGAHASLAASDAACTAGKFAETASFALVLQRSGPLTLGYPAATAAAAAGAGGAVPSAGFAGIAHSIVVHVIAKRLPAAGASSPPPQLGGLRDGAYAGPARCRIVVAVYGPPGRRKAPGGGGSESPDGRPLLASGAVLEQWLPVAGDDDGHEDDGDSTTGRRLHHPLQLAVEYLPPSAMPQGDDDGTAPLTSRLRVAVLDTSSGGVDDPSTRVVVDARLPPLEVQLATAAGAAAPGHPGRGRLWVGCTAEAAAAVPAPTASAPLPPPPAVALTSLDAVGYSEDDDGWGSLSLAYAVPWPLHVVLHSGATALYADVFRFLRRARSLSLALQDVWRALMAAYSSAASSAALDAWEGAAAGSGGGAGAAPTRGGVSAQLSGAGGKRAADPAVHARRVAREAALGGPPLRPVWLLRARMALVVDALLYHLHVDVVSAAQARWEEAAAGSADFASLAAAHTSLLASLASGSFLAHGSVLAVVLRLLAHVERFTRLVGARAAAGGDLLALAAPGGDRDAVAELAAAFDADTRMLQAALATAGGQLDAGSLLTRLAFSEAPE